MAGRRHFSVECVSIEKALPAGRRVQVTLELSAPDELKLADEIIYMLEEDHLRHMKRSIDSYLAHIDAEKRDALSSREPKMKTGLEMKEEDFFEQ